MSKKNKSTIISFIIIVILFVCQLGFNINHALTYQKRVEQGNARWNQVEARIVTVENRLDRIEERVDKIEKGL